MRGCLLAVGVGVVSDWELGLNVLLFLDQVLNVEDNHQLSIHWLTAGWG